VDLALAIAQGIGLALACGIRPFLPALLAGALASDNLGLDFGGTRFDFLEQSWFLLAVVVALVVVALLERRRGAAAVAAGPTGAAIAGLALGLGALLCTGSMADVSGTWWPGIPIGLASAAAGQGAARGVLAGAAERLDAAARAALPFYADGASLVLAVLAVALPPVSLVALALCLWLLVRRRRRAGEKYAGLRVLR
jgi:Domain of unknown function (DUF4126)